MKYVHAIALTAASAAFFLGCGAATAQTVSAADPYEQGYAAGAATKERNSFEAFDKGYQAGQTQTNMQTATNSAQAYNNGYQAGVAASADRAVTDRQQAFNQGYEARRQQDARIADRAFDDGYNAGASRRSYEVLEFP